MEEREFYKLIEGRDEAGKPNAMCTVNILMPDENDEPKELASVATMNGAVYMAIVPYGLSMIDIIFDEPTDFDYLQMGGICEHAFALISTANAEGTPVPSLTLSVSQQGDFAAFMTCMDCVWSYIPTSAEKICTGIRFITKTENIHFLELTEGQVVKVLDEIQEDMLTENLSKGEE